MSTILSVTDPARYALNPYAIPTFLTAAALLALAALVLVREGMTRTARAFAFVAVSAALWQVCFSWMYCARDPAVALWWAKTAYWVVPLIPAAIYQFTLVVTGSEDRYRRQRWLSWAAGALFAVLMARTSLMFHAVEPHSWGFYPRYTWPSVLFVGAFVATALLALRHSLREYREAPVGWHRERIRAFTWAFAIAYLAMFDYLPAYGVPFYPFGYAPVLAFVALTARAVLRYRLVDVTPAFAAAQIVATAPDALIAYDSRNRIRFANPAACALLELDENALAGLPVEALIDGHSEEDTALREALARGSGQGLEGGLRNRRGERIDVRMSISTLRAYGTAAGAVLVAEDVRQHRAADAAAAQALRTSEARFRALAGAESALIFLFQGDRLYFVSPGLALLCGRPAADLLRTRFWELAPEGAQEALRRHGENCLRGEGPLRFEVAFQTRQGGERLVDLTLTPLRSENPPAGLGIGFDVTERRLAEQGRAVSDERFRSVLGGGRLLSVLLDPSGTVTQASEALRDLLGRSEEEILGAEWFSFVPEHDRDAARRAFRAAVHSRDLPAEETGELLAGDGETRLVAWNATLLRDPSGAVEGVALVGFPAERPMRVEEHPSHPTYRDPLTGLASRAQLLNRLVGCIEGARGRPHYRFALLFGDIDRFKLVNESLGHPAGDKLLIEAARRLETCVRHGDVVARVGGDEYAVLLDDIGDSEIAQSTAERIHRALERPFTGDGRELFLTMSVGIALNRSRYRDPEEVLRDAQTAMSHGRRAGRARSREFETAMHAHAMGRLQIESDLRRAVERDELQLVYQPVVSLATAEVVGFEALLRWDRAGHGRVLPDRFIGIAEETGLILGLGRWAMEAACAQLRRWQDRYGLEKDLRIHVNVSAAQFKQDDFGDQVERALGVSGATPQGLKLEVTESVIMDDPSAANVLLLRLRESGVGICLDDFGTGYSSLSYLTRLPAETLKIDKSFVSRIAESVEQEEMVRAIVGLAHALKMAVIAEGVETREQLERLRAMGCEYVQGFYLARPLDVVAAEEILTARRPLIQALRTIDGGRR